MSATAILSPVTVPAAAQAGEAAADVTASDGAFAALLAVGISDTMMSNVTVSTGAPGDLQALDEDSAAKDALSSDSMPSTNGFVVIPLLLQLADVGAEGSAIEARPQGDVATATEASTNTADPQPASKLVPATHRVEDLPLPTPVPTESAKDADTAVAVRNAEAAALATLTETTARRSSTLAGDAALASLKAMPGAASLQQATITQRKIEAASGGSPVAATDDIDSLTVSDSVQASGKTSALDTALEVTSSTKPVERAVLATVEGAVDLSRTTPPPAGPALDPLLTGTETLSTPSDVDAPVLAGAASTAGASASILAFADTTSLSSLSRATIETTTQLAAQMTQRLAGQSTRFELGLTPEGLGRVDVTLDIDSDGQLSARLAFDNPLAATELRGRADDLRRQLEDAGFTLARDALDFSSRDSSGGGGDRRQQRATAYADRHAAQIDLADTPPVWTLSSSSLTPRGVDVKV